MMFLLLCSLFGFKVSFVLPHPLLDTILRKFVSQTPRWALADPSSGAMCSSTSTRVLMTCTSISSELLKQLIFLASLGLPLLVDLFYVLVEVLLQ